MIGELNNVSIGGMLRLLSVYQQTGCLKVTGEDGEGEIYLDQGRLIGTGAKRKKVTDEILRLMLLKQGYFHFESLSAIPPAYHQGGVDEIESLIMEASRRCEPSVASDFLPSGEAVLQLAPIYNERTHVRVDLLREEWNFLTKVNGEDSLFRLYERCELPKERALQVAYGLLSAGFVRKIRFRIPEVMDIATRELGNMGEALVRQAFRRLNMDPTHMHMRELIALLNELERNITLLLGPTRANAIVGQMWEGAKR